MTKGPTLPVPKASGHSSKCARISEELAEVVEPNSNKMPDSGAMIDSSKRRHEAPQSASDSEDAASVTGSYSLLAHLRHRRLSTSFPMHCCGTSRHSHVE